MQLSDQEIVRREKLSKLRALGINPYPADLFEMNSNSTDIKSNFEEGRSVTIAGRLMSRRIQGKASFAELQDSDGRLPRSPRQLHRSQCARDTGSHRSRMVLPAVLRDPARLYVRSLDRDRGQLAYRWHHHSKILRCSGHVRRDHCHGPRALA